jgi:AAT family amino acid transporter
MHNMNNVINKENLAAKLTNRHIQMIALGGAIGTGFFLGSSNAINLTGPSIVLAYILGGFVMYIILRVLGEMTVDYPNSGSYIEYARLYIGEGAGFIAGWNGWILFTMAIMLEVTATGTLLDYWFQIPHWITCLVLLLFFGGINIVGVGFFGETEFWFAGIKISVIILMIVFGSYLIFAHAGIRANAISNIHEYTNPDVFFYHGALGFLSSFVFVCLSFCGSEFLSIAVAESEDPAKITPKAVNGVIARIIVFYVLTLTVILLMYHFKDITAKTNPFTDVFSGLGFKHSADFINLVAITAALSALNSCIYISSRMLYRLSLNGQAPKLFSRVSTRSLPKNAVLFTIFMGFIIVIMNYSFPQKILNYLFSVISVAILLSWFIILITHFFFRAKKIKKDMSLVKYPSIFYPFANIIAIAGLLTVLVTMFFSNDDSLSRGVYALPIWLCILFISYKFFKYNNNKKAN